MSISAQLQPSPEDFDKMQQYSVGYSVSAAVYSAIKLGILDEINTGTTESSPLAKNLNLDEKSVNRLLRTLVALDIVNSESDKYYPTALSMTVSKDAKSSLRDLILMTGDEWHWNLWGELSYAVMSGEPAFNKLFHKHFFEFIQERPDVRDSFNKAMTSLTSVTSYIISERLELDSHRLVVDVGGGQGILALALLKKYPNMQAIVFDLPSTAQLANKLIEDHALTDRCQFIGGNFMEEIPANGNVYIIKQVFHGLDNQQCITILKNIAKVAAPGAVIYIIEMVIPEDDTYSYSKFNDLEMMLFSKTGKEREEHEFKSLLKEAGYDSPSITRVPLSLSIIKTSVVHSNSSTLIEKDIAALMMTEGSIM